MRLGFVMCAGLAPSIPEDLYYLVKKAVSVRRHLEKNRKDKDSKFRLILVEVSFFNSFGFFHSYVSIFLSPAIVLILAWKPVSDATLVNVSPPVAYPPLGSLLQDPPSIAAGVEV